MANKLTVACVYKKGEGFTPEYVDRLEKNVAKYLHTPYQFEVVTPTRKLPPGAKGFWTKLELFKRDRFHGPVVYLDLDTILVGSVTEIFTYPHVFTMGTNWQQPRGPNSSFMAWDGSKYYEELDKEVTPEIVKHYSHYTRWGDQYFIYHFVPEEVTFIDTLFPDAFVSYKLDVLKRALPPTAKIVAFHGTPRPHKINWELP